MRITTSLRSFAGSAADTTEKSIGSREMAKARLFSTAPVSAMQDTELTALDWRLLLWVSLHDGRSLVTGKGAGCYASNRTLFAEAGCEYSAGCRSLSRLVSRGHLQREHLGRSTRYRVVFAEPDRLPASNISPGKHVASSQANCAGYVAEPYEQVTEIYDETGLDYSPLSGELDSVETEELDSTEVARPSDTRDKPPVEGVNLSASSLGINLCANRYEKDPAEAGLGSEWLFTESLPKNFSALPIGAQVQRIERAFEVVGRDPERMNDCERDGFSQYLYEIHDAWIEENEALAQQALRLHGEMARY